MRLLRVELKRLLARGTVRWSALGLLVVVALLVAVASLQARPLPADEVAQIRASFEVQVEVWEDEGDELVAQCQASEDADPSPGADYACDEMTGPVWEDWIGPEPTFATSGQEQAMALPLVGVAFALLVGVTFVAAEISTGSVGLWLTFEPRRSRVYWSKAAAAAVGVLPAVAAAFLLGVAGIYAAYAVHGRAGDADAQTWVSLAQTGGRTLVAAALVALAGAGLGAILRHTAAALGALAVWFLVVEMLVVPGIDAELQRWLFGTNLTAWLFGGGEYGVTECRVTDQGQVCEYLLREISQTQGGLVLLAVAVGVTLLAVALFRRRDVS